VRLPLAAVVGAALVASCGTVSGSGTGAASSAPPGSAPSTSVGSPSTIVDGRLLPCPPSDASPVLATGGLPDTTLPCLDPGAGAQQVRLAGLRGKPLVLSVWASWCEPCRTELPTMAQVAKAAGDQVRFLGVDVEDQPGDARALAGELGVRFNSVQDPDGATKQALGWIGPPITLFVDADGHVVGRTIGSVGDAANLRSLIRKNLGVSVG